MAGKCVTIYTDSRYSFGVTHDFGALWKHRKCLKSDGRRIMNAPLVAALLEAILLPVKIAICKCAAHTINRDFVSTGNARADVAAKDTAAKQTKHTECTLLSETDKHISSSLQGMQAFASGAEKNKWKKCGCRMTGGVWISSDGKPCLPRHFFPHYAKSIHGKDHVSKGGMVTQMKELWFTKGFTTFAEKFCKRCVICNTHNVAKGIKMSQVSQPTPIGPFFSSFFFNLFTFLKQDYTSIRCTSHVIRLNTLIPKHI